MHVLNKRTFTVMLTVFSVCMIFVLSTAPLARAQDDTDASSTPDTTQTDTTDPTTPPETDSSDASSTPDDSSDSSDTGDATSSADVTTGDASSDAEAQNTVNNDQTDSDAASTTVDNTNSATTTNDTSSDAATGDNTASSGDGSASVSTGDALSQANVINVVNANITNSSGLLEFLNAFGAEGYDLSNLDLSYFDSPLADTACSFSSCNNANTSLTVNNTNSATVTNTVISTAETGDNTASSTGDAGISTGNAAASANVVNVVNTNITDSHYLLVALNNFGDLGGNIVLPSTSFFDQLMSQNAQTGNTTVSNDNTATLNSTTTADADTGDNTASSTGGDADVSTGNALSNSTTVNQVNTNQTGGTTVFMLINVFGNWTGNIQGLPSGLSWSQTQNGIAITGGAGSLSSLGSGTTTVSNTNNATVNNNVQVYALTGQNQAASASGTADIATGNAYASANVVNLVNTNILGQNWILAIMNVFGNWTGNLDFGQPDLWLGAEAQTTNPTQPGSQVIYTFTVSNNGDVDATNVVLNAQFDPSMLTFDSGMTGTGASWDLGTIPASTTEQFSYTATAGNPPDGTTVAVPVTATVTEDEDDANPADNTDDVTIAIGDQLPQQSGSNSNPYQASPKLIVHKTASLAQSTAPTTVNYTVTVEDPDNAGPAFGATLTDTLVDPNGTVVYTNSWDLDTINPGDDITLTYSVDFDASSTPGAYLDTSVVTGYENYDQPYINVMPPASAVSAFAIVPNGEVLGASTSTASCSPLLTSYIMQGGNNNSGQVSALQWFLNTFENAALAITGTYDKPTIDAVKAFQQKYASDILTPWGMTKASGNVYYTTENEINNISCGNDQFSLTAQQQKEIQNFHTSVGGTYGVAKHHSNLASKPKQPSKVIVQATTTPVVAAPLQQQKTSSLLNTVLQQLSSAIGVPFAHAQSQN